MTYTLDGTIFYNPVLTLGAFGRHTPPYLREIRDVFSAPSDADAAATALWNEAMRQARGLGRDGAVHALAIRPGRIAVRVINPATQTTISVRVSAPTADAALWSEFAEHAARDASFAAAIANGIPPDAWMDRLRVERGQITFEIEGAAVSFDAAPQPLAAAAWPVFAQRVGQDPWLWLLFRGQTREGLLDLIGNVRAAQHALDLRSGATLDIEAFWRFDGAPAFERHARRAEPHLLTLLRQMPGDLRIGRRRLSKVLKDGLTRRRGA